MTLNGRDSNRLPHDFSLKFIKGGNEYQRNYRLKTIILVAGIDGSRWCYLSRLN
jgi:hypothetical protein